MRKASISVKNWILVSLVATSSYLTEVAEKKMILLALPFIFVSLTVSIDILVRREENYGTIVWDGDCSKLRASYAAFDREKLCICKKKLNVNGIKSELNGFFYQTVDGSLTCLYDQRETGKWNVFTGALM